MGYGETFGSLLEAIAEEADAIAMRYFRAEELRIDRKGDGTAVTEADRSVEVMGGGDAQSASTSGCARMIIDPIDGTEEFSRGIPTFGTLMGIELNGEIVAGMASAPGLRSRWWAYRGEGAYRNGKRIHVSSVDELSRAMIFTTGTGPKKDPAMRAKLRLLSDMARNGRSIGGFWQHMLVAEGATEVAVDLTSQPWDLAPLGIIVEEAGGRSTNLRGERTIYSGQLVSTNGKIHDAVLKILE